VANRLELVVDIQNQSAGLDKEIADVAALRREVEQTAIAAKSIEFPDHPPPRIIDTTVAPGAEEFQRNEALRQAAEQQFEYEQIANQVRINALREEGAVTYNEYLTRAGATTAELSTAETEVTATKAKEAAIESQMQAIAQTRLELVAAQVRAEEVRANQLRAELEIRTATLGVMRSEVLSEAELAKLTEQEAALLAITAKAAEATASGSLLASANLGKAKAEAIQLAKELATGGNTTRTLGALLGSLGTTLTVAGIGGYALFNIFEGVGNEVVKIAAEEKKSTDELDKQITKWIELARAAKDFGDVVKLQQQIAPALEAQEKKFDEIQRKSLSFWETIKNNLTTIPFITPQGTLLPALEHEKQLSEQIFRAQVAGGAALTAVAKDAADAWQKIKTEPFAQGIDQILAKIDLLKQRQAQLQVAAVPQPGATIDQTKQTSAAQQELARVNAELKMWQENLGEIGKSQTNVTADIEKAGDEIRKADFTQLDPSHKLEVLSDDLTEIGRKLRLLGVDVATPNEALEVAKTLTGDTAVEVAKLAIAWSKVYQAIAQVHREEESDAQRERQKEIAALLREQQTDLEAIHQQQTLINSNPFLFIDERNRLLLNSFREEVTKLSGDLQTDKRLMDGGSLDPVTYERVKAEAQKLGYEIDVLKQKLATLNFGGEFRADLTQWVNSFGTAAHQAASILTGTLNTAIGATSQALTGLIFQTGNWRQTFASAAQSIVQNIIQIALQYVVSRLVMEAIDRVTGGASSQAATSAATKSAAAWAPAAESAAIASYGAAVAYGTGAYLAGLAVAEAAAIGLSAGGSAAHTGAIIGADDGRVRLTGPLSADERLTRTLVGEGVFTEHQMLHLAPTRTDVFSSHQLAALATGEGDAGRAPSLRSPIAHPGGPRAQSRSATLNISGLEDDFPGTGISPEPTPIPIPIGGYPTPPIVVTPGGEPGWTPTFPYDPTPTETATGGEPSPVVVGAGGPPNPTIPTQVGATSYGFVPFAGFGSPSVYPTSWSYIDTPSGPQWVPHALTQGQDFTVGYNTQIGAGGQVAYVNPVTGITYSYQQLQNASNIASALAFAALGTAGTNIHEHSEYLGPGANYDPGGALDLLRSYGVNSIAQLRAARDLGLVGAGAVHAVHSMLQPPRSSGANRLPVTNRHSGGPIGFGPEREIDVTALTSEFMMKPAAHKFYGTERMDLINNLRIPIERLKLHDGGSAGNIFGGGGAGGAGSVNPSIKIVVVADREQFKREIINSDELRVVAVDAFKSKAHEIGLNAV
jgi:hypothetical protein